MRFSVTVILAATLLAILASPAQAEGKGPSRIDFDERLIKGQTAKAGSVYIYQRKEITIHSLVRLRRSFRHKIIRTVFEE